MGETLPVTAVVLVFEAGDVIEELVRGIIANRAAIKDVVVVDNGSRDGSAERCVSLLHEHFGVAGVELVPLGKNLGVGAGHWTGWQRAIAREQAVLSLEHDTILRPGCVRRLVNFSVTDAITAARLEANIEEEEAGFQRIGDGPTARLSMFTFNAVLFRPNQLRLLGPPRSDLFVGGEDFDYSRRAQQAGLDILQVNDALALHANKGMSRRGIRPSPRRQYFSTRNGIATLKGLRRANFFLRQSAGVVVDGARGDLDRARLRAHGVIDGVRHRMGPGPWDHTRA